jgi:hypothetical protein
MIIQRGTPLDVMSHKELIYERAGFLKGPKTTTDGGGGEDNICPDGTNPPCKTPTTQIKATSNNT